ncbi:MAG: efflux RND transporter permease subunit [Clostridia bacterium]|nr:efflux RND transporter permease subunit [Clostridia bacterium]
MKLSDFSVSRPVAISMVFLMVVILGLVSMSKLAIDLYPELNFPVAAVVTNYEGAGPQEIETLVTRPMEEIMGTVNNVDHITSQSMAGTSLVLVWYNWGTDMNFATLQMREKLDRIKPMLPDDIDQPSVLRMDPSQIPIVQIGMTGGQNPAELRNIAEDVVKNRLERLEGVASVVITGGLTREIQVQVDPVKLQGYGLSLAQVVQALRAENLNLASGEVVDAKKNLAIRTLGEFRDIAEIENILVGTSQGNFVRLRDISEVTDGFKKASQLTRMDGQASLGIHVLKQTGSNVVQVAGRVNTELKKLEQELAGKKVHIRTVVDFSEFVKLSIANVKRHTISGAALAVLVLFLFLRNWRSTVVVALSIPISIISTFILLYSFDMTLNMMSLGGLALGVGRMVDDSIVILENIYRHRQEGYSLIEAAKKGSSEVATAVMASTFTTVVVFLPIVFVEGLASELFRQMALTVCFSLLASLFVSLTLIPMLSSKVLHTLEGEKHFKLGLSRFFYNISGRFIDGLDEKYRRLLVWALSHRKTVVFGVIGTLVASLALLPVIGAEFMPKTDTGEISVNIELPKGTVIEETSGVVDKVEAILDKDIPEVKTIFTGIGATGRNMALGGSGQTELAQIRVKVGKRNERTRHTEVIADDIRSRLKNIPGAKFQVSMSDPQQGGPPGGAPVQVTIKGDDLGTLQALADRTAELVKKVPGTREVESSLAAAKPELQILIDRERAGSMGLTASQIANTIRNAMAGQVATKYRLEGDEIDIRVKLVEQAAEKLSDLSGLIITAPGGQSVPLRELAFIKVARGPVAIDRENQSRQVTVSSQIIGRDLRSITKDVQAKLSAVELPPGYQIKYGGQNEEMMKSFKSLAEALLLAVILVYMVMAFQFESLLYPFIIMFSMPTTFIGVVLALAITGRAFSVPAFMGVIMLAGIVVTNAIVLVDYINVLRGRGMERDAAILKAGPTRLRPILMTALTTVLGLLPLTLGLGEGAEAQAPMATVVVGGLTVSTLLTLVLIPVVYTLFDDLGRKITGRKAAGQKLAESVN